MRSFVYNGVDLSEWCSAEVIEKVAVPVVPDTMVVPGRAGALLVSGHIPPRLVRVRLFMDAGFRPGTNGLADIRHRVYAALCSTSGGTLRLPDEPEFEYRDVICTDTGSWSSLFEDGQGEVTFDLLDPVAYGRARSETSLEFEVGGVVVRVADVRAGSLCWRCRAGRLQRCHRARGACLLRWRSGAHRLRDRGRNHRWY